MVDELPPFAPAHTIELIDDPQHERAIEALLCVSSGGFATRARSEVEAPSTGAAAVRIDGLYGPEPPGALLAGPTWVPHVGPGRGRRWRLDLHRGLVEHEIELGGGELRVLRFASAARPATSVVVIEPDPGPRADPEPILLAGPDEVAVVAATERCGSTSRLRVAAAARGAEHTARVDAQRRAAEVLAIDPPALVTQHVEAWARRWTDCDIRIDGAPRDELAIRFALFHLLSLAVDGRDELAVGARGLTGPAYAGHVFWDADVFVLPVLAAIAPEAASAMLAYRANRLGAARARAAGEGRPGARFPWESAATGAEVTPAVATRYDGTVIPVRTGEQEIHIGSDIAWSVLHHATWSGDRAFLDRAGAAIVVDTARYLASRVELDTGGRGHLRGVIGPDEYHEDVDDDAFTNVMLRWHLRRAAELVDDPSAKRRWRRLAGALVDGYRPDTGHHEQFAGFDALDPVLITAVAEPPVAADLLLGREAVAAAQIVKQPDVVMLHHLVPDELPSGSRAADLAYYLPRTAHGSSLSPAIHAAVLARAGRPDDALHWLRIALRLDLDDLSGTTAGGVHIGTMAGAWQALAFGYLGLAVRDGALRIDPVLPSEWSTLRLRFRVLGRRVEVCATADEVVMEADRPLTVGSPPGDATRSTDRLRLVGGARNWESSP